MGSYLSSKIAYYTGWLMPEMEGISKEVFSLAQNFNGTIIGISKLQPFTISFKRKVLGIPSKWLKLGRCISFAMSKCHVINHIYDSLDNWLYLSSIKSNMTILTGVVGNGSLPLKYYQNLAYITVDSEEKRNELIKRGIVKNKIKVIYPGIELEPYLELPTPIYTRPFKILFASSPPTMGEIKPRGVLDILNAAKELPNVEFIMPWRPWGNTLRWIQSELKRHNLKNIILYTEKINDMRKLYCECHAVIAPFKKNGGKSCPTSILEALASGRPVIVGPGVGIRKLIVENKAGLYYSEGESLSEIIKLLQIYWDDFASNTRPLAVDFFSLRRFVNNFERLYKRVLS